MSTSILCFGSSQAEVMDYVFHGDARYVTNEQDHRVGYVGGASSRGLKKERNRTKTLGAVADQLARQDVSSVLVFLAYGSVDVEWTVPYKQSLSQDPDPETFVEEMISAFMDLVKELQALEGEAPVHEGACVGGCGFLAGDTSEFCCKKCEYSMGHGKQCEGRLPPPDG